MGGIVKADSLAPYTLLMGKPGHGTTTEAIRLADAIGGKVLVLSFGAAGGYSNNPLSADFDIYQVTSLKDFAADILAPKRQGRLEYDVIIHEKLNAHLSLVVAEYGNTLQRQDWGAVSNTMYSHILTEQSGAAAFIATVDLMPDDEGDYVIPLNRNTTNKLLPLFSRKVYCYVEPVTNDEGDVIDFVYHQQTNPAAALAFVKEYKD